MLFGVVEEETWLNVGILLPCAPALTAAQLLNWKVTLREGGKKTFSKFY